MFGYISAVVVIGASLWFFRKRKPKLSKCAPEWSPINVIWYDSLPQIDDMSVILDEHDNSVTDQGSWRVLADDHFTTRLCEELYDLPGSPNTNTDVVSEELLDLSLPTPCWEELYGEDGTE